MSKGSRRVQVNRQQKSILLLALFLLKYKNKRNAPPKNDVLRFIERQNLMAISDSDFERTTTGELAWENDLAWRRTDLKMEGHLAMPYRGAWQITSDGEDRLLEWVSILNCFISMNDDWENKLDRIAELFGEEKVLVTPSTIHAAQEAYNLAQILFPSRIPAVPESRQGRVKL